jgi:hypothetical protein
MSGLNDEAVKNKEYFSGAQQKFSQTYTKHKVATGQMTVNIAAKKQHANTNKYTTRDAHY